MDFKNTSFILFFAGFMTAFCSPVFAQKTPQNTIPPTKPGNEKLPFLDLIRHDPKKQGPLLFVSQYKFVLEYDKKNEAAVKQFVGGKTPAQFAQQRHQRVLTIGGITSLVPDTMKEIVKNLGKPDPFAGMRFDQRFTLVLATFTRDQWKQAGSANGIGLNDLNEDQRALFSGIWGSDTVKIQTIRTPKDNNNAFEEQSDPVTISTMRFRLSRQVSLQLRVTGKDNTYGYKTRQNNDMKGELQSDGSYVRQQLVMSKNPQTKQNPEDVYAFGVPVVVTVPNRQKISQLPLDAAALNVGMSLDGSHKTVGELLAAVSAATRFRLIADKRLATFSIGYKLAPGGQIVSTADVLKTLCRSVTGTFRRLDGPNGETVYLLTDDVEGIGTRLARLDRWAEKPRKQQNAIEQKAIDDCAESEPLDSLGFAPDYPYALSADQLKTIDDSYRSQDWKSRLTVPVSQLSPALKEEFKNGLESWRKWDAKATMQTDVVSLDTNFHCDWILPGGQTFPANFNGELDFTFLRQIAVPKSKRVSSLSIRPNKNPAPTPFPASLKARIAIVPLPEKEEELSNLFALLARKGFNEAWLRVETSNEDSQQRLQNAITVGAKAKMRVGLVIPWLLKEEKGTQNTGDVNILGETEETLLKEKGQEITEKQRAYSSNRFSGWVVPGTKSLQNIVERVAPFVKLPSLSAVLFTNSAAPGYEGYGQFGDGYSAGDRLGYNDQLRFRCVQEKGFDPIDLAEQSYNLGISAELPFFSQYELVKPLAEFRKKENKAHLDQIYTAIRSNFPQTAFHLEKTTPARFTFASLWEKPDSLPKPDITALLNKLPDGTPPIVQ